MASPVATPSPVTAPAARPEARLACTITSRFGPGLRNVKANSPTVSNTVCKGSIGLLCQRAGPARTILGVCTRQLHGQPHGIGQERRTVVFAIAENRSDEHTSELQSLMRISYAVFCLKKKKT